MNIEEERKAFEKVAYPNAGALDFKEGAYKPFPAQQSRWSQQVADHANRLFPVWLAAKEHAKPVIDVFGVRTLGNVIRYTYTGCWGNQAFDTKEAATAHALERGFRLKGVAD